MNDSIINPGDIVYARTEEGNQEFILVEGEHFPCIANWGEGWEFRDYSHWYYDCKRLAYSREIALFDKILANNGVVYNRSTQTINKLPIENCTQPNKENTGTSLIIAVKKREKIKLNFNL